MLSSIFLKSILHHLSREGQLFDKNVVKHFSQVMQSPASNYGKVSSLGLYLNAPDSRNIQDKIETIRVYTCGTSF
jgi:hypothetical protein